MAAMMTICNPGDKVMIFSPFYENYGADAILSGAEPIYIPLVPPTYEFDISLIEKGFAEGAGQGWSFLPAPRGSFARQRSQRTGADLCKPFQPERPAAASAGQNPGSPARGLWSRTDC